MRVPIPKLLFVCLFLLEVNLPAQSPQASLHGAITDPSGASVPGALIQLRSATEEFRAKADGAGQYSIASVRPGKYLVRVIAKGFTVSQRQDFEIKGPTVLDVQLTIETETQVVNVEDEANKVSADAASNGTALVLGSKELAMLSDDPDEFEQELQAMAGPGAGPSGGQIYIDGFTGGNMPPKSSIREVRINSNPFSAEYDRPGFGRIEIFTKPGSDSFHGQAFAQYNDEDFNSRSPLLTSSQLPPYKQAFFGASLGGPLIKNQASFGLDFEHRTIDENAFILATTLDSSLNPQSVNQAVVTPQSRDTVSPRLDYKINANNTLVARYQFTRIGMDKQGVGNYNLPSTAYNQTSTENTAQITETDILSPRAINETRFQYMRSLNANDGNNSVPTINVTGAFVSGGAQIGKSGSVVNNLELSNTTTFTYRTHTFKWGGRLRESFDKDTSVNNFGGSYTFFGGEGPELDANNQPIAGTEIQLTALDRYRRTLLFEGLGYSASEIQALGGGASQFSLTAGRPTTTVDQFDAGLFAGDDWRVRSNLTLSYGLRYEAQTNIHDLADWAPRFGLAWGIGGGAKNSAKTVLRAGLGMFYDRIASSQTLQAERYNGVTQQSYLILNPDFYPAIPSASELQAGLQPQQLQLLAKDLRAPETLQASVGIERQVNSYFRISAQYIESRGIHLLRTRNINTPIDGVYPYGDADERILSETTGFSRSYQLFVAPNLRYKKMFLFGFYALSYGQDDSEGLPANPYNLRAEWGPSSFADVRHRAVIGTSLPVFWKFSVSPFLIASSGTPYNITTGQDTLDTGSASERPAFLSGVGPSQCQGGSLVYKADFGCFDLDPAPGMATIERNWARGPANVTLNLRLSRTWSFGNKGESGLENGGPPPGMGGARGGGPPPGGGGPGGGGPPPGMFGSASGKKYNLTFSVSARNALNHPNYATPSGDLSSPYFGEYRSLAGLGPFGAASTYNRKIDLQLRFQF
jgi:hypothetical protein